MITVDDEEMEKRIIAALEDKPLCSEDLLHRLGIEPGGGEAHGAIWSLLVQGTMRRRETFLYELTREIKKGDDIPIRIEILYMDAVIGEVAMSLIETQCIYSVHIVDHKTNRSIFMDEDQFRAAFMREKPEELSMYHITERDVGKMITVTKG